MVLSVWVGKRRSAKGSRGGKADFNQIKEQTRSELLLDVKEGRDIIMGSGYSVSFRPCQAMFQYVFHITMSWTHVS